MEKEINFESGQFELNFYYDGFEFSDSQISVYQDYLSRLTTAFDKFVGIDLGLKSRRFALNLNICDDNTIIDMNREYRAKEKITDVLSFPLQENIRKNVYDQFLMELELGDIYICNSICEKQAKEFNLSFIEEFVHLATHGFLHLLGYDHDLSEEEEKVMEVCEEKILLKLGNKK